MKNTNRFEIVKIAKNLSTEEQIKWHGTLQSLKESRGILSLCLDGVELFVEYDSQELDEKIIRERLLIIGFPILRKV